jgi:hypothetical protein
VAAVAADLPDVAAVDLPTPAVAVGSAPWEEEVQVVLGSADSGVAFYCLFVPCKYYFDCIV